MKKSYIHLRNISIIFIIIINLVFFFFCIFFVPSDQCIFNVLILLLCFCVFFVFIQKIFRTKNKIYSIYVFFIGPQKMHHFIIIYREKVCDTKNMHCPDIHSMFSKDRYYVTFNFYMQRHTKNAAKNYHDAPNTVYFSI